MMLAGVPVPDRLVLSLAGKLRDAGLDYTAQRLLSAQEHESTCSHSISPSATTFSKCSRIAPWTWRAPGRVAQATGVAGPEGIG